MGTLQQVILLFLGHFFAAQSFRRHEDAMIPQDFGGLFDDSWLFPFDQNFDFPTFDTFFSSWKSWTPDFHMLGAFPPVGTVPRVQVFCDETMLTLLVEKNTLGLMLTAGEIQLGDGCYSNKELPNQLVFDYNLDQCGTTPVLQNGVQVFTNSLHLNLKKMSSAWWQTPPMIHVSCTPKRTYADPNVDHQTSAMPKSFDIQAMNPSWTSAAESNIYKRGQVVNLQVSGPTGPDQQLFIHSCFVSASSEPQSRPRHVIILNKGCASSLGSPFPVAQFASTNRAGVVNFIVNTSSLISELYVHCSVVILDQGVSPASKSCSYNVNKSRWEELDGEVAVCGCCSSKCRGSSVKNLSDDAKAVVSIGPLVIVDDDDDDENESSPALPESEPQFFSSSLPTTMRSDTLSPAEDASISAALSSGKRQSSPQGVIMVSQDPGARITLWLPGQVQAEQDNILSQSEQSRDGESIEQQKDEKPFLKSIENPGPTMKNKGDPLLWDMNLLTLVDGWPFPSQDNEVTEFFPRKPRFGRSGSFAAGASQADSSLPNELNVNLMVAEMSKPGAPDSAEEFQLKQSPADLKDMNMEDVMQMDTAMEPEDVQPIIRTRLEFSKSADGSKKLSYEEEVKQNEIKRPQGKREPRLKGLRSTFLDLLRRMDKAE